VGNGTRISVVQKVKEEEKKKVTSKLQWSRNEEREAHAKEPLKEI
jgi:hypothetical protein